MKILLYSSIFLFFVSIGFAQTEKEVMRLEKIVSYSRSIPCNSKINQKEPLSIVDGVPMKHLEVHEINPDTIKEIKILKDAATLASHGNEGRHGVVLISTKKGSQIKVPVKEYAYKVFELNNSNWNLPQDMYNAIRSAVPNVQITHSQSLNQILIITMRGDDDTILIVDGVRQDMSILNIIDPNNIESIKITQSPVALIDFLSQ